MLSITMHQGHTLETLRRLPPEYITMARQRLTRELGMLAAVEVIIHEPPANLPHL